MVAGEASGDLLASLLLSGLKARWPALSAAGIGGPRMQAEGFDAWWPSHKLSVFGYVDALRHYRELVGIRNQLRDRLLVQRPDVFIGVDAPDFNFGLEQPLKAQGIRTVHFVCPSIWAWRGGRVKKLAAAADHVLCLFPFEPALLAEHGVAATFVGHPMADRIPLEVPQTQARSDLGLAASDPVVALLPGSRRSELQHIMPGMIASLPLIRAAVPAAQFVVAAAPNLPAEMFAPFGDAKVVRDRTDDVLADRKSTRLNSSHTDISRMPSSA